jgi:uncharacterized damage-inducible protein DinB
LTGYKSLDYRVTPKSILGGYALGVKRRKEFTGADVEAAKYYLEDENTCLTQSVCAALRIFGGALMGGNIMSEIANILDELREIHNGNAWHGPALHELLAGLTPEQASARLVPNAHSIWEIVLHIAGWENVCCRRLEGDSATEPAEGDFPRTVEVSAEAWSRTLAKLESEHERLLSAVANLSDSALDSLIAGRDYSVRFLLRGIIHHHVYHAGQIALLRKA